VISGTDAGITLLRLLIDGIGGGESKKATFGDLRIGRSLRRCFDLLSSPGYCDGRANWSHAASETSSPREFDCTVVVVETVRSGTSTVDKVVAGGRSKQRRRPETRKVRGNLKHTVPQTGKDRQHNKLGRIRVCFCRNVKLQRVHSAWLRGEGTNIPLDLRFNCVELSQSMKAPGNGRAQQKDGND